MDVNNTNSNYLLMNPASNATLSYEGANAVYGSGGTDVRWNHINRISSTDTNSIHLDIDFATDSFNMNVELGTTEAEGGTLNETSWEYGGQGNYNFDLTGSTPTVNAGIDGTDPSKFNGGWILGGNKPTTDEESYAQVDFDIPVDMGAFTAVKVGVKYRDQKRTQDREAYSWHWGYANDGVSPNYMTQIISTDCPTLAKCDLALGSDSVGADVVNGDITQQLTHNSAKMLELGLGPDASYAAHKVLGEIFEVEEKKTSFYLQGDFSGDDYRGNLGVRVAKTDQDSSGYLFSSDSSGLLTVDNPGLNPDLVPSTLEWVTESRSYTEILPNFNLSYDSSGRPNCASISGKNDGSS